MDKLLINVDFKFNKYLIIFLFLFKFFYLKNHKMENVDFEGENNRLLKTSEINLIEIRRLSSFLRIFVENYKEMINSFNERLKDTEQIPHDSILLTNINGLFQNFLPTIKNSENILDKIIVDIISPLEQYKSTQHSIYQDNLFRLGAVIKEYRKYKNLLEYSKNNYYKLAYDYHNFEEKNKKLLNVKKEVKDKIIEMNSNVKANELLYKYELEQFNNKVDKLNVIYDKLNEDIKRNEETRITFIKSSIDKFKNLYDDCIKNLQEYLDLMNNYISDDICEKDKKFFYHEINKYYKNKDKRIPRENFISYLDYVNDNSNLNSSSFQIYFDEKKLFPSSKEEEQKNLANQIINELLLDNDIQIFHLAKTLEQIKNPLNNFSQILLDIFLEKKKQSTSLKFTNLKNMEHFSNLLSYISISNNNVSNPLFKVNFKIIFLAERIYYQNKITGDKIYLSALLSKNKFYKTKTFWENIIETKLANKLEDHIERLKNLILPEEKNLKTSLLNKLNFLKVDVKKTSIVGLNRINNLIKNYSEIEDSKVPIIDRMATNELSLIIRDNIPTFCSFNLYPDECLEMISDLARKYYINKDYINFYVIYFHVSFFTVRKEIHNENYVNLFKKESSDQKNIILISSSLEYLNRKDYLNLITLSKQMNKKLIKKIYKITLRKKTTAIKTRLNIWENILNIRELKKKYNYKEILDLPNEEKVSSEIEVDIQRTYFKNLPNQYEEQKKISNILNSISKLNEQIKYCQGMNYIVSFLLEIVNNEEETFYIFLSFFKSTEYSLIFEKDLDKLKCFFYIFQRLISLYEPEIYNLFNSNSINVNYFLPHWFITLFLSSRQYLNQEETPYSLIRILDNFFVGSWKNLMKVGIFILHSCEENLRKMKYEEMLSYLINEIKKFDLFSEGKLELLEKCFFDKRISKKLIHLIEDEYRQDEKLKNNEKKA